MLEQHLEHLAKINAQFEYLINSFQINNNSTKQLLSDSGYFD